MMGRLALILSAAAGCLLAQPNTDKMLASSVAVYGTVVKGNQREPQARGGGFVIDSRHVVTSFGDCCGKTKDGQQMEPFVLVPGKQGAYPAKAVWNSDSLLVAVLELQTAIEAPALALAPLKLIQSGQAVHTVQLPDPDDKQSKITITGGTLQSVDQVRGVQVLKTSAAMVRANMGGALFDACANVIGVNMGIEVKGGLQIALAMDPLIAALPSIGVQATVATQTCGGGGGSVQKGGEGAEPRTRRPWRLPEGSEWIPVALLLGVAALAFRRDTRRQVARALTKRREPIPPPPLYPSAKPALHGISGQYAGASIALEAHPSMLGRDQHGANLVFPPEADSVSKNHCTVRWDAPRGVFVLEDLGSTNGTFLASGERLNPGQPRDLRPGDRFYIGDLRNQFEVRMEQ